MFLYVSNFERSFEMVRIMGVQIQVNLASPLISALGEYDISTNTFLRKDLEDYSTFHNEFRKFTKHMYTYEYLHNFYKTYKFTQLGVLMCANFVTKIRGFQVPIYIICSSYNRVLHPITVFS